MNKKLVVTVVCVLSWSFSGCGAVVPEEEVTTEPEEEVVLEGASRADFNPDEIKLDMLEVFQTEVEKSVGGVEDAQQAVLDSENIIQTVE